MPRSILTLAFCCAAALAQAQQIPLEEAAKTAAAKSTLTTPGAPAFHLKAHLSDEKKHDSQWDADVEEWWQTPTFYRRVFHSQSFSQTLIVNGSKVEEHNDGPVFPELLRNLTVELVDTIPRFDQLAALHKMVDPPDGKKGQIRASYTILGTDGTTTHTLDASIAISKETGLMVYGGSLDWDVALHDFAPFHDKQIARRLTAATQGGPQLTAKITLLEDLTTDPILFKIHHPTPFKKQLRIVVVPETDLRKLSLDTPPPRWPNQTTGKLSGSMSMRVVVDRQGNVRSIDNFFSDNPALQQAAEQQLILWRFHPYRDHGAPVQVISTLTFPFTIERAEPAP